MLIATFVSVSTVWWNGPNPASDATTVEAATTPAALLLPGITGPSNFHVPVGL